MPRSEAHRQAMRRIRMRSHLTRLQKKEKAIELLASMRDESLTWLAAYPCDKTIAEFKAELNRLIVRIDRLSIPEFPQATAKGGPQ